MPSAATVLDDLASRRALLDGAVLSGGEPTLQEELSAFLGRLKGMGFAIKLNTNGSRPDALRGLLEARLLDCVAMDLKAPYATYARLAGGPVDLEAIRESVTLLAASGVPHEFRTTFVPPLLTTTELAEIRTLVPQGSPWRIQPFRPEYALDPRLLPANGKARWV